MKHRRKVKNEQVTILQMAQQLKTKNINDVPGQQFCRQCKAKFLLETDSGFPIVETILVSHPTIFFEDFPIKTDGPMGKPPLKNEDPPPTTTKFKRSSLNGRAQPPCSQYLWESHCIDDQNKFQSVTDTGSEFTEYQTPRKNLQSIGI